MTSAVIALFSVLSRCSSPKPGISHIIHMGQSLGAGEHSLPIVSDSASFYGNLRFKIGTHTWKKDYFSGTPEKRDLTSFEFVPLTAVERGHEGETIGNGLCDHLSATSRDRLRQTRFLFSFTGEGGRLIRELDKKHNDAKDPRASDRRSGGNYYQTVLNDVQRAKNVCEASGLGYNVFAFTWMQGESNNSGFVNRWENRLTSPDAINSVYIEDFIQLKRDLQQDVSAITGQKEKIPFFTYQTAGPYIGSAQLMATEKEPDMYMVGPTYMLPNAENSRIWGTQEHGDQIHLTADGERWLGEMFAKVIRKVKFEKAQWKPLQPLTAKAEQSRNRIIIKLHVPVYPLVIDTTFLPAQGKTLGFEIYNDKMSLPISKVEVSGGDEIKITLEAPLPAGNFNVRYAWNEYVSTISRRIQSVSEKDSIINGVPFFKLKFGGNVNREFEKLANEGAFYLANNEPLPDLTSVIVRKVYLDTDGNTTLLAERGDLYNGIAFKPGQQCHTSRMYTFGNIRDSDNEVSTYRFADGTYGNRKGRRYPLNNWLIMFDGLPVVAEK